MLNNAGVILLQADSAECMGGGVMRPHHSPSPTVAALARTPSRKQAASKPAAPASNNSSDRADSSRLSPSYMYTVIHTVHNCRRQYLED